MYSLDFSLISSGVGGSSSLFTRSKNNEAILKFLLLVDSYGSPLLLKLSRSFENRPIDPSSLCLLFKISSQLSAPSFRIQNDSTEFRKSSQQCHVLLSSWLPRTSVPCLPDCLVSLCRLDFHHSSCLAQDVGP